MTTPADRRQRLQALLDADRPLEGVLRDLAGAAWDSEEELVTLRPSHLIGLLRRYLAGTLDAKDVERWANAVEGRDDIGYEPQHRDLLSQAIFDLANPALQGALTNDLATGWIGRLSGTSTTPGRAPAS